MPFYQQLQLLAEWLVISSLFWRLSRFRTEEYQIYLLCDWKWSCPAESGCCFRQPKAYCTVEDVPLLITFLCFLQWFYWREAGPRLGHDWALGRSQQSLTNKALLTHIAFTQPLHVPPLPCNWEQQRLFAEGSFVWFLIIVLVSVCILIVDYQDVLSYIKQSSWPSGRTMPFWSRT